MTEPVLGPVKENGNLLKVMINNQNKKTHFTESREEYFYFDGGYEHVPDGAGIGPPALTSLNEQTEG